MVDRKSDTFGQRSNLIFSLAIPSSFFAICRRLTEIVSVFFIGSLNDQAKLAGLGMGIMVQNLFAMSIFIGFSMALDTLISHAAGAGKHEQCGLYLNRARVITLGLFLPISAVLLNTERLLVSLGQDQQTSAFC